MQNVQNAAEIQQRVMNLVDLYRTRVGKESEIAIKAKEAYNESFYIVGLDFADYVGQEEYEDWVKHLMVNEQLLGYFYSEVVGGNADKDVLNQLQPDVYDKTIFSDEEEDFLKSHFKEMVNYIIQTPCDGELEWVSKFDDKDRILLPNEVLELIKSHVKIPVGAKVYYPFAGFVQFSRLYNGCHFLFDEIEHFGYKEKWESWIPAWKKLALHANNVDAEFLKRDVVPHSFDAAVSFVPVIPKTWDSIRVKDDQGRNDEFEYSKGYDASSISKIHQMYNGLLEGGKMILITKSEYFWDKEGDSPLKPFWEHLIADNAIVEIIQLPSVMNWIGYRHHDGVILIAEKGRRTEHTTMMDVRAAFRESDKENSHELLDIDAIYAIENNHGKDPITGLRKMVQIPSSKLKANLLLPQMYVIEKPSKEEHPVPISTLCTIESTLVCDVKYDLPIDTPWITIKNLLELYQGPLDISKVENANCPNNPENWKYGDKAISKFWMGALQDDKPTWDDYRISQYRYCTFLDGNSDVVLYDCTPEHGVRVGVVRATGKPYAVSSGILVFCPKDDFDANSLAALLRMPIVYRQLIAYQEYGLGNHLNEILVPTDKRIIVDELYRMKREESVSNEWEGILVAAQEKYKATLDNYQHTMRKHIQQISSAVRRMERFIKDMDFSEETKQFLIERLHVIKTHRLYLSEDIERLNEENSYGEASPFDIDHCLRNYREYFGSDVCSIKYINEVANDAIRQYRKEHQEELKELDDKSWNKNMEVALAENSLAYVDIAEYNFGKIVRNILENAKKHGFDDFTDVYHKDCMIEIVLNWDKERQMYRIDFRNNGNPLPEGITKASYGENRKYAGKTGGTGIGGYEVAENVRHYDGDYAITQDGDWVVVSIYLPKSKTYGERL